MFKDKRQDMSQEIVRPSQSQVGAPAANFSTPRKFFQKLTLFALSIGVFASLAWLLAEPSFNTLIAVCSTLAGLFLFVSEYSIVGDKS